MTGETFYTAVDMGTSKVSTVIARIGAAGDLKIVGLGVTPSQGIAQGRVEDAEKAKDVVRASVEEANLYLGRHQSSWTYVSISGDHISCLNTEGQIQATKDNGGVTRRDMHHLIESSYPNVAIEAEVLHVIPIDYEVDGLKGVRNPVGLHADYVKVESHIVLGETLAVRDVVNVIKGCGLSVGSLVAQSLAAGEAVLSQDERELGVVLADVGAGTVDVTIFRSGNPWYSTVIPLGGVHVTRDLAAALDLPFYQAEELKLEWADAIPDSASEEREVVIPGPQGEGARTISQRAFCQPILDRLEEIIKLILLRVSQAGLRQMPPAGLVITGGCAEMPGLAEKVRTMVGNAPVRVAQPENISGLPSALSRPAAAATVGTLLWGIKHQGRDRPYANGHHTLPSYKSLFRRRTSSTNGHTPELAIPLARRK